jgi:hypothetical protein
MFSMKAQSVLGGLCLAISFWQLYHGLDLSKFQDVGSYTTTSLTQQQLAAALGRAAHVSRGPLPKLSSQGFRLPTLPSPEALAAEPAFKRLKGLYEADSLVKDKKVKPAEYTVDLDHLERCLSCSDLSRATGYSRDAILNGSDTQLFADDHAVQSSANMARVLIQHKRKVAVVKPQKSLYDLSATPGEHPTTRYPGGFYGSVVRERPGVWHMFVRRPEAHYPFSPGRLGTQTGLYFGVQTYKKITSRNGIHFDLESAVTLTMRAPKTIIAPLEGGCLRNSEHECESPGLICATQAANGQHYSNFSCTGSWWEIPGQSWCHAGSQDGITWTPLRRGSLGQRRIGCTPTLGHLGGAAHRTIHITPDYVAPFYTTSLTVNWHEEKQLFIGGYACGEEQQYAREFSCMAHSSDGIVWTRDYPGQTMGRAGDSVSQLYWDNRLKSYRYVWRKQYGTSGHFREIRGTQFATLHAKDLGDNISSWIHGKSFYLDSQGKLERLRRQIYSVSVTQIGSLYVGLFNVLEYPKTPAKSRLGTGNRDVTNIYLATSRDGEEFDLSWIYGESPLVKRALDGEQSFDYGFVQPASEIVTTSDQHILYYEGRQCIHEYRYTCPEYIARVEWDLDRIVGIQPEDKHGWAVVITKPLSLPRNSRLHLNMDASQAGASCAVEIVHADREAAHTGFDLGSALSLSGDSRDAIASWKTASLAQLPSNTKVRLRFFLYQSRIFSFWFGR